jgi:hypothetical protein
VARSWITLRAVAGTLVAVALSGGAKGKAEEDQNMEAYARAYAKQVFGCADRSCVFAFTDYNAFITKLKTGPPLEKLGILCHSSGGTLQLPEPNPARPGSSYWVMMPLGELGTRLGSTHPRINRLEFLGCGVGSDPLAIWDFLQAVNIDVAVGHSFFHAFQPIAVSIKNDTTEDFLKEKVLEGEGRGTLFSYLLPGTNLSALAAKKGRGVQIWVEYYIRDDLSPNLFSRAPAERRKDYKRRAVDPPGTPPAEKIGPEPKQIFTQDDAAAVTFQLGKLGSEFTRVEVIK